MKTTRYLIHTIGDQSLTALAFVTEDLEHNKTKISILPVDLMRMADDFPMIKLSDTITEELPLSDNHEAMCLNMMRNAGIPKHHQVIFQKVAEPITLK